MEFRILGSTGISVSAISFGAGPVPGLMTDASSANLQRETIAMAIQAGINWFDTASTYGDGESERSLGAALNDLGAPHVHVATKVRLMPEQLESIKENVKASVAASLQRLQRERITLVQLHNSITHNRGDQYTSLTPHDVLRPEGVLDAFQELQAEGLVQHIGLTGLGDMDALAEVIRSGQFETKQVCYNIVNPSAGRRLPAGFEGENYCEIIR